MAGLLIPRRSSPFPALVCLALFTLALVASASVSTAQAVEAEALFKRGLARYQQGKYVSARLDFNDIVIRHPSSDRVPAALMMLSKTYFSLENYDSAESTARTLRRSHPSSPYTEWTDYMIAACRFRTGDIEEAVSLLAGLIKSSGSETLRNRALSALKYTILPSADRSLVYSILDRFDVDRTMVESVERPSGPSPAVDTASGIAGRPGWIPGDVLRIGLLAPLSGMNVREGEQLREGVASALDRYREIGGMPVELLVEDTASNPVTAALKARTLISEGVIAIIGPVYGESTMTAALVADRYGIPFLAPTAPDIGISDLGTTIFQLNLSPVTQAEALAEFTGERLGFDHAAVIASNDFWGEALADTFTGEFESRGGVVIQPEFFEPNVNRYNFNDILLRIRSAAPKEGAAVDSMLVFDFGNSFADTVIVRPDPKLSPQKLKTVDTIDCIVLSAFPEDAVRIARQVSEYNINTVLVGDSGWSTGEVIYSLGDLIEGAYLVSTENDIAQGIGSDLFVDDFGTKRKLLSTLIARRGYDACGLLIHCLGRGARSPGELIETLEGVRDFRGLSSTLTIDPKRHLNTAVEIVQVQNGRFVPVSRISRLERPEETVRSGAPE